MSLDPNTLKEGDKVRFGNGITKRVAWVGHEITYFSDRSEKRHTDTMWDLAELVKPELPEELHFGSLCGDFSYYHNSCYHTPGKLLRKLKQDVKDLEAAGVEEEE